MSHATIFIEVIQRMRSAVPVHRNLKNRLPAHRGPGLKCGDSIYS